MALVEQVGRILLVDQLILVTIVFLIQSRRLVEELEAEITMEAQAVRVAEVWVHQLIEMVVVEINLHRLHLKEIMVEQEEITQVTIEIQVAEVVLLL